MVMLVNACFGKVVNPQPTTLLKKCTSLQRNWSAFTRYCTFNIFHFILSTVNPQDLYLACVGEELRVKFCFGSFCFVC